MLFNELIARDLRVLDHAALEDVWRSAINTEAWNLTDLFIALIQRDSILHDLLGLQHYDLSVLHGDPESPTITNKVLAEGIEFVAAKHGHKCVSEVHLFAVLLARDAQACERQLAELRRQELSVDHAMRLQIDADLIRRGLRRETPETIPCVTDNSRFRVASISVVLDKYLTSPYFPFSDADWSRYMAAKAVQRNLESRHVWSVITSLAFAARSSREARLGLMRQHRSGNGKRSID